MRFIPGPYTCHVHYAVQYGTPIRCAMLKVVGNLIHANVPDRFLNSQRNLRAAWCVSIGSVLEYVPFSNQNFIRN
jgi:hypothetical protein